MKWPLSFYGVVFLMCAVLAVVSLPETRAQSVSVTAKVPGICGNEIVEVDEQCDGSAFGGRSCTTEGFGGGTLQCNADCTLNTSSCTSIVPPSPPTTGGGGGGRPPERSSLTDVKIKGRANPNALVTILVDGRVQDTVRANNEAVFDRNFVVDSGAHDFSVYSVDQNGRRSLASHFSRDLLGQAVSVFSDIFIAPTIEVEKTEVKRGDPLLIHGQTVPLSKVLIYLGSKEGNIGTVTAGRDGMYSFSFGTGDLPLGEYEVKARSEFAGAKSAASLFVRFVVGEENILRKLPADSNGDRRVNVVDFSILLYYWGSTPKEVSREADINKDGQINLKDLSVMLYYWTG